MDVSGPYQIPGETFLTRPAVRTAAIVVAITLCTIIVRWAITVEVIGHQDEGILVAYPDLILRGFRPYHDFAVLYSPGGFYFLAGLFKVFGSSVVVERGASLLYWSLIMIAMFLIGSRIGRTTGILAAITALAYSSLYQSPGAHPHFAAFACMLFALLFASSDTRSNTWVARAAAPLAGVLSGLAVWMKQDLGVVAVLATLSSFALGSLDRSRLEQVSRFLLGLSIPACGMIIFVLLIGPASVIDSLILDPLRAAPGRVLPFQMSLDVLVVIVCLIIQLYGAVIVRSPSIPQHLVRLSRGMATATLLFAISLLHRFAVGDISWVGSIVVSLTVISMPITLMHLRVKYAFTTAIIVSCFLIGLLPVFVRYFTDPLIFLKTSWVVSRGRVAPWILNRNDVSLQKLLDEINMLSSPGDKLFVGPTDLRFALSTDTFLYYLLPQLVPASRYLEMNPGSANRENSGLAEQILTADWLILTSGYDQTFEPNASVVPGPTAPNEVVRTHFCAVSEQHPWVLLRRCADPAACQRDCQPASHD